MKNLLIFTTVGQANNTTIQIEAATWGELKQELTNRNIQTDSMKAVVGETRVTLESPHAQLPEGDFTLYLMPVKNKSGSRFADMAFQDLRKEMKAIFAVDATAKEFFTDGSKNWTQLSKVTIISKLEDYNEPTIKEVIEEVVEEVIEEKKEVIERTIEIVESVKEHKEVDEKVEEEVKEEVAEAIKESGTEFDNPINLLKSNVLALSKSIELLNIVQTNISTASGQIVAENDELKAKIVALIVDETTLKTETKSLDIIVKSLTEKLAASEIEVVTLKADIVVLESESGEEVEDTKSSHTAMSDMMDEFGV